MTESELKRALIKSIRAQGGVGYRTEDRFLVGWPDCVFIPEGCPVFFTEVKLVKRNALKLQCTETQEARLKDLTRPPHAYGALVTFNVPRGALYVGRPGDPIAEARYVPIPRHGEGGMHGNGWLITELLKKYLEAKQKVRYNQGLKVTQSPLP